MAKAKREIIQKEDCGFVSLYYGEEVHEEDAQALVSALEKEYPDIEFMLRNGKQPLYYYYVSAE